LEPKHSWFLILYLSWYGIFSLFGLLSVVHV